MWVLVEGNQVLKLPTTGTHYVGNRLHEKWTALQEQVPADCPLYWAVVDIEDAYGSVLLPKLRQIIGEFPVNPGYESGQYSTVVVPTAVIIYFINGPAGRINWSFRQCCRAGAATYRVEPEPIFLLAGCIFFASKKGKPCCDQGFGAGVFGWSRSRHFGPAPAPP